AFLMTRTRLEADAALWQRHEQDPDYLLPGGKRVVEAAELLQNRRDDLGAAVAEYVAASVKADGLARRRRTRRRNVAFAVMAVLTVLALIGGLVAGRQRNAAVAFAHDAEAARAEAETNFQSTLSA